MCFVLCLWVCVFWLVFFPFLLVLPFSSPYCLYFFQFAKSQTWPYAAALMSVGTSLLIPFIQMMLQYLGNRISVFSQEICWSIWPELLKHCMFLCWAEAVRKSQGFGRNAGWCVGAHEVSKQRAPHLQGTSPQVCSPCSLWLPSPLYRTQDQLLLSLPLH